MSELTANDLTFYKEMDTEGNEIIKSGGFSVSSIFLKKGGSPIFSTTGAIEGGNKTKVSSIFDNLAVPVGLSYQKDILSKKSAMKNYDEYFEDVVNKDDVLNEDIHEKLLKMVELDNKRIAKGTRKVPKMKKNKTRKMKKSDK